MSRLLRHIAGAARAPHVFCLTLLLVGQAAFAQFKLTARLEPANAQVGDTVVYSLTVEFAQQPPDKDPDPPTFQGNWGFTSPHFAGKIQKINRDLTTGRGSQSAEYRYDFQVSKAGTFDIPPSVLEAGGTQYKSNVARLTVVADTSATQSPLPAELQGWVAAPQVPGNNQLQKQLNGAIFVLPIPETTTPYDGQQLLLGFHLCVDQAAAERSGLMVNTLFADRVEIPDLKQFLKDEIYPTPRTLQFRERDFGGKRYLVAPLYQVALTPTKTGKLTIEPFKMSLWFNTRGRNGGARRDPFDDPVFNDPFFGGMSPFVTSNRAQVIANSPTIDLNVKPLPTEGRPNTFAGAVGDFKISANVDKQTARAGDDVVKLSVKVEGKGDAAALHAPTLGAMDGIDVLEDPKTSTDRRIENDQLISSKQFDYILRPTKPGDLLIPPVTMLIFNPSTSEYGNIETEAISLDVKPGSVNQTALVSPQTAGPKLAAGDDKQADTPEAAATAQDLRYIHLGEMKPVSRGALSGEGPLFAALLAGPPLLMLAGWFVGRRRAAFAANRGSYREAAAGAVARRHLKSVSKLLRQDNREEYFGEMARAVRGFFGDKFHLEPADLTVEHIRTELERREAGEDDIQRAVRLLEQCDQARYSPVKPEPAVMQQAYTDAAQLLSRLEKVR